MGREMGTAGRDDPDHRLFAEQLKAMREHAGLSREELAAKVRFSVSTIANIETAYRAPTPVQARAFDEAFGLPGVFEREEQQLFHGKPFSAGFRPFEAAEREALSLRVFEHSLVPGLCQTQDYARIILSTHPGVSADQVGERVMARLERQMILGRGDPVPPLLWVLLDEAVLYREIGGPKVMRDQLSRLAELARRPDITIQLV